MKSFLSALFVLALSLTSPALAQTGDEVSECDRLAAHPFDPGRPDGIPGVHSNELESALAIPACEQALKLRPGHSRYQFQLARSLLTARRYSEALKFQRMAAEQNYPPAQFNLGFMYIRGFGVAQNYSEALKWYRKAAEQGYALAQHNIALMYHEGQGVAQNHSEALKWFVLAAEQDFAPTQHSIGFIYLTGQGVEQDYAKAFNWFTLAAEQGYGPSQLNLGMMYVQGRGLSEDAVHAHMWLSLAAAQGIERSAKNRDKIAKRMTPDQIAAAQQMAREWLLAHPQGLAARETVSDHIRSSGSAVSEVKKQVRIQLHKYAEFLSRAGRSAEAKQVSEQASIYDGVLEDNARGKPGTYMGFDPYEVLSSYSADLRDIGNQAEAREINKLAIRYRVEQIENFLKEREEFLRQQNQ